MRRDWATASRLKWAVAIVLALAIRLAIVSSWHAPAGDGVQYYRLSQELAARGRFAFGAPPAPLTWSRLPGYPLFLAYVSVRSAPLPLEAHLLRATRWNVVLDVVSALLMASLIAGRGGNGRLQLFVFALVVSAPLLVFLSCYGLGESLATFLATTQIWLAFRATQRRPLVYAAAAGVAGGLAQLVRVDMAGFIPVVLAVILLANQLPLRTRLLATAIFAVAFVLTFAPWVIRNRIRFGAAHPQGTEWIAQDGRPLPTGMMRWMRSWSGGRPGEAYDLFLVANNRPLDPGNRGQLMPVMYDDAPERAELKELFEQYNRERLSPAVDARFAELASRRARQHSVREYLLLPLRRLATLWAPVPEWELPMRTKLLGLPRGRVVYDGLLLALIGLGLVGTAWVARVDRTLFAAVALSVVLRSAAISLVHPFPTQRYLAEVMPLLMTLAALALAVGVARIRGRPTRTILSRPEGSRSQSVAPPSVGDAHLPSV